MKIALAMGTHVMTTIIPLSHAAAFKTSRWRKFFAGAFSCLAISCVFGEELRPKTDRELADLSIEELMNETVTSVSKREQKVGDVAAAVYLLTNDDIRRSGAVTIPDVLRLVPGMDVASVNSRESAVSARGFNTVFSTKLLVMVDGRVVYTPFFAGVLWDLQQTMLDDLDRIEVIRGPGATVWGANAVNGVINVVSRSAKDTPGGLIYSSIGDVHTAMEGLRYGGRVGDNTYYRVFGSYQSNDDYRLANGGPAGDGWHSEHGGFRIDHYPDASSHFTWQADATDLRFDKGGSKGSNFNTIGRWTRQLAGDSSIEIQAYYDRVDRTELARVSTRFDTWDLTAQHTLRLAKENNLIWGFGYRAIKTEVGQTNPFISVRNAKVDLNLYSAFLQDEHQLLPDKLIFTAGVKVEHNDFTGYEFQPSVRLVYKITAQNMLWAAVSRAVRTPDEVEGKDMIAVTVGAPFPGPGGGLYLPAAVGNGHPVSEVLWAYEAGYRFQPSRRVSLDFAGFYNRYSDLISYAGPTRLVPGTPFGIAEIPALNLLTGESYGGEASVTISPTDSCRVTAGYSLLFQPLHGPANASREDLQKPPKHQLTLRASYDVTKRLGIDGQIRYVGALESIPGYLTADLRLSYRMTEHLELSVVGQNLLDKQHPEQSVSSVTLFTEVPRGVYAKLTLHF